MPDQNISLSMYTTTYVDNKPLKVELEYGNVSILVGGGITGMQHLILPAESALALAEDILAALNKPLAMTEALNAVGEALAQ